LQDPENKTFIKADEKLREIFGGKDRVSMFEMTKLVFTHVT
jgi:upstream activation factor subunit UAF30